MEPSVRARLIALYKEGPGVVDEALEGITDADLDARPGPADQIRRARGSAKAAGRL